MFGKLAFSLAFQVAFSVSSSVFETLTLRFAFESNVSYFLSKNYPLKILSLKIICIILCQLKKRLIKESRSMRLLTWNVRGLGAEGKKGMIKTIIKEESIDMVGLVETKHKDISEWDIRKCWGHNGAEYMHVTVVKDSGGLLLSWHKEAFK